MLLLFVVVVMAMTLTWSSTGSATRTSLVPFVPSLKLGADLTQVSADPWRSPPAVSSAQQVLSQAVSYVEQPIMGWGVDNPEPSPGVYDWASLDRRVAFIESTGATPVLTLAGAPDWMKGGQAGTTDWSHINQAPTPAHFQAFAQLAAMIAERYPEVHYFQVWSELKGFWDQATNTWNAARYTHLYNDVYEAVRAVAPTAQIGGPYVTIDTWGDPSAGGYPSSLTGAWGTIDQRSLDAISYWLSHAVGAEFLSVDGGLQPRGGPLPTNPAAATAMFAQVDDWLRAQTTLPIWWSEYYVGMPGVRGNSAAWLSLATSALLQILSSGAQTVMLWDPERYRGSHSPALWTSTTTPQGGQATGLASVFDLVTHDLMPGHTATLVGPPGTQLLVDGPTTLAVNATDEPVVVGPPGRSVTLAPYEVLTQPGT